MNTPDATTFRVLGLMSGTSLDGIDLASCRFFKVNEALHFTIEAAETLPYPPEWSEKLPRLHLAGGAELAEAHASLGRFYGQLCRDFMDRHALTVDCIGSHGHTVFHQPQKGFTLQIGDGGQLAAVSGVDTVCDFRSKDLAMGGQGAPLVPVCDRDLFSGYAACLNLGGIANVSGRFPDRQVAWDICPANMALNTLAQEAGKAYDENGALAAGGQLLPDLLAQLEALTFYASKGPKSLGREWYESDFLPLVQQSKGSTRDKLNTLCEHIALRHQADFRQLPQGDILVTGGGAFNSYLMERISACAQRKLIIPESEIVQFKEALAFAYLAYLRIAEKPNVLCSATGSAKNHVSGAYYKAG